MQNWVIMMPLFLLQNKIKTTVTGVEMFKKTLDYGQVRIYFLFIFYVVLLCCVFYQILPVARPVTMWVCYYEV